MYDEYINASKGIIPAKGKGKQEKVKVARPNGVPHVKTTGSQAVTQKLWVLGDASFAPTGEKSQQGIVVYNGITSNQRKGGNLVQWRSSRQDLIAKSTCKAELIASSEALQQGRNISIVISEMINSSCDIEVSSDNAPALHMVRNGSETAWRTRHIRVKAL